MFDAGLWELFVIGVVALIVIGPERLPGLARTAGLWIGRARRFLGNVKADIDRELRAEELKRILEEQKKANPLHQIIEETGESLRDVRTKTEQSVKPAKGESDKPNDSE